MAFARCHLLMGSWQDALDAAQVVLNEDKRNIKSVYVKAESLFNMCEFEHSLVLFHRGLVSKSLSAKLFLVFMSEVCIHVTIVTIVPKPGF